MCFFFLIVHQDKIKISKKREQEICWCWQLYAFNRSAGSDLKVIQQGVMNLLLGRNGYITMLLYFRKKHETFYCTGRLLLRRITEGPNRDWVTDAKTTRKRKVSTTTEFMADCNCVNISKHSYSHSVWQLHLMCHWSSLHYTGGVPLDLFCCRHVTSVWTHEGKYCFQESASMPHDTVELPVLSSKSITRVLTHVVFSNIFCNSFPMAPLHRCQHV